MTRRAVSLHKPPRKTAHQGVSSHILHRVKPGCSGHDYGRRLRRDRGERRFQPRRGFLHFRACSAFNFRVCSAAAVLEPVPNHATTAASL